MLNKIIQIILVMVEMTEQELNDLHEQCNFNKEALQNSERCSCIYCLRVFDSIEVTEWIRERNAKDTAVCPYCSIDAIIPGEHDSSVLKEMYFHWFKTL